MNSTEIKKALYKEKSDAEFQYIRKGNAYYYADLEEERIYFEIPVSDMGNADFTRRMEANLLSRWLLISETT